MCINHIACINSFEEWRYIKRHLFSLCIIFCVSNYFCHYIYEEMIAHIGAFINMTPFVLHRLVITKLRIVGLSLCLHQWRFLYFKHLFHSLNTIVINLL